MGIPRLACFHALSASLRARLSCDRLRVRRTQTKRGQPKSTGPGCV